MQEARLYVEPPRVLQIQREWHLVNSIDVEDGRIDGFGWHGLFRMAAMSILGCLAEALFVFVRLFLPK
jgi:hypothetical protein